MVTVLLVRFAVGSAMTLPPERTISPREVALAKRRGKAISKSTGDGKNEVALVSAPGVSIAGGRDAAMQQSDRGYQEHTRCRMIRLSSGLGHGYGYCECRLYHTEQTALVSYGEWRRHARALMVCSKFGRRAGRLAMATRPAWGMPLVCGQLQLTLEMEPPRGLHSFLDRSCYRFSQVAVDMVEIRCPNPGRHAM